MSNSVDIADSLPIRYDLVIKNQRGLHARAAAKFVKLAGTFDAEIEVSKGDLSVSGLSIMGLMMLGAAPGCTVTIRATGSAATTAAAALANLVNAGFDEE